MKPRLFIGCSTEGLPIANAAQANMSLVVEATVWNQGIFQPSRTAIHSLLESLPTFDFAMFIFSPDDVVKIRGDTNQAIRDNVIFELGLAAGIMRETRCFVLIPDKSGALRIPTDLIGLTPEVYETGRADGLLKAATGPACHAILESISRAGPRPDRAPIQSGGSSGPTPVEKREPEATAVVEDAPNADETKWFTAFLDRDYAAAEAALATVRAKAKPEKHTELDGWLGMVKFYQDAKTGTLFLEKLIAENPKSEDGYWALARSLQNRNQLEKAVAVTEGGMKAVGDNQTLIMIKTQCLVGLGETAKAEEFLTEVVARSPDSAPLHLLLADFYIDDLKDATKARAVLEDANERFPSNDEILAKYAGLLNELPEKQLSLVAYTQALQLKPKSAAHHGNRANVYWSLDFADHAMRGYKKANELADEKQDWLLSNIGNVLSTKGLYTDAIEYLQRAIKLNPESQYAHDRLSTALKNREEENKRVEDTLKEATAELARAKAERRKDAVGGAS